MVATTTAATTRPSLDDIVRVTRKHVLEYHSPDSCIASTRAVIDVARYFGFDAKPQPVHVKAMSPLTYDLLKREVPFEQWPAIARYIHLGDTDQSGPGRWDAHLIALLRHGGRLYLLDPSIDQAARPERDIRLEPLVADITETGRLPVAFTNDFGTTLYYEVIDAPGFRRSSNWRHSALNQRIAAASIRELKGQS